MNSNYVFATYIALFAMATACSGTLQATHDPPTPPRSCIDERQPSTVNMRFRQFVTVSGGVRWYFAEDKHAKGLAWLRADGELGFMPLPTDHEFHWWRRCTPEGADAVRCFNGPVDLGKEWVSFGSVRVELGDPPQPGTVEVWEQPAVEIERIVSDGTRALSIHDDDRFTYPGELTVAVSRSTVLTLWDVAKRRRSADQTLRIDGMFEVVEAWCADTCTVIGLHWDALEYGDRGPGRLLVVTVPDGRTVELGDMIRDPLIGLDYAIPPPDFAIVRSGDAMIVAWQELDQPGLLLAAIDPSGHIRARSRVRASKHSHHFGLDEGLLGLSYTRDGHDEWQVLEISAQATVLSTQVVQTNAASLLGARFDDGLLLAALPTTPEHVEPDHYFAFRTENAEVEHHFLHPTASIDRRVLGHRPGTYHVFWLTRPERAALFLWPPHEIPGRSWLIPVRAPCP
jgi:hypothetical protein